MSGPSALGTLLVQRLDTVLGTSLSQQTNLISGARPDAVSQPAYPERTEPVRNDIVRHSQENVDRVAGQIDQRRQAIATRTAPGTLPGNIANTQTTNSAPTTLGPAARIILELLNNYSGNASITARQPLIRDLQQYPNPNLPQSTQGSSTPNTQAGPLPAPTLSSALPSGNTSVATLLQSLPASTALANALVQSLFQAISSSGVFYESHLAQLLSGQRSVAELRAEPQAQQSSPQSAGTPNSTPSSSNPSPGSSPETTGQQSSSSSSAPLTQSGQMPADLQSLVRLQLEVLANQTVSWRGEVWPEAEMEWEISKQTAHDETMPELTEGWSTRVRLELPQLGLIHARLTLAGQQIVMQIEAPESANFLSNQSDQLHTRLTAVGMQLNQLNITDSPATQEDKP